VHHVTLLPSAFKTLAAFVALACFWAVLSTPSPAAAQTQAELSEARAQFQRGIELEQAQNWGGALKAFRQVGQVKMMPQVRYHIALCEENLGKLVAALGGYELALADAESVGESFKEEVEASVNELRARIPKVVIERGEGAEAASIELDGVALGASSVGVEVPVDPGPHSLVAEAAGYHDFSETFEVAEEETRTVRIAMEPLPPDDPLPSGGDASLDRGPTEPPGKKYGVLPYVLGGVGVASLAASGVVQFALRRPALQTLKKYCTKIDGSDDYTCEGAPPEKNGMLKKKNNALATYDIVVPVTLGVGIAALGAGVTLFLLDRQNAKGSASASTDSQPGARQTLAVLTSAPGADLGGLSVQGSF
jgi:hypothetical protein